MRERVQEILMEIGIPANLKGFKYILDIMELFEEDEAWRNAKMMIVYEKVARMNKTNYCRVESLFVMLFPTRLLMETWRW